MKPYRDRFLRFLSLERNASANTIASYRLDIDRYVDYLAGCGVTAPDQVTQGTSDRSGTLVDNKDGTYKYTFTLDLTAAKDPGKPADRPGSLDGQVYRVGVFGTPGRTLSCRFSLE